MPGLVLDAGALIAVDRNVRGVVVLLARTTAHRDPLVVPAGVVGLVWRDGRKQARLARLLSAENVEIETVDDARARSAGQLCGMRGTNDVIDASVVLCARARGLPIVTSDARDLRHLDPSLDLIEV